MSLKSIETENVFNNTLVTNPKYSFRIYKGEIKSKNNPDANVYTDNLNISPPEETYVEPIVGGLSWFDSEDNSGLLGIL